MKNVQLLIFIFCISFVSTQAFCLEVQGDVPEEAEIVISFLQAVSEGNTLGAVDEYFDFEAMGKRLFGDEEYEELTDAEKKYVQQLLNVFAKAIYRQRWFYYSLRELIINDISIEDSGDAYMVRMKYVILDIPDDFSYVISKADKPLFIDILYEKKLFSERIREGYEDLFVNIPADEKTPTIERFKLLDFLEFAVIPSVAGHMDLNEYWDEKYPE